MARFGWRGSPELAQHRARRIANVADSATLAGVLHVAKMPHQRGHPACARRSEPQDLLELLGANLSLNRVGFLPSRRAFGDGTSEIDACASVNFELFQSFVKFLFVEFRRGA
jgi:hypothetical protein